MDDFLVLFLLNRILANDNTVCEQIIASFSDDDTESQIILNLKQHGIKKYMNDYYKDNQHDLIESIYNQLMSQFDREWKQLQHNLKSTPVRNHKPFEYKLFNQRDIVPFIFQFIDLKSLCSASLVNVTWLLNAFNSNSVYFIDLRYLLSDKVKSQLPWRRCSMARHINLLSREIVYTKPPKSDEDYHSTLSILLDCIQFFTKIQDITLVLCHHKISIDQYFDQVWKILNHLSKISHQLAAVEIHINRIEHEMKSNKDFEEKMQGNLVSKQASNESINFDLCNVMFVSCGGLLMPMRISNKCETLSIGSLWCIDNTSDFSGVKNLILTDTNSVRSATCTLSKVASKFNDIKFVTMKYCFPNIDTVMFWQAISKKIAENDGKIRLNMTEDDDGVLKLNKWLKKLKDEDMIDELELHQLAISPCGWSGFKFIASGLSQLLVGKQVQSEKIQANIEWLCFRFETHRGLGQLTDIKNGALSRILGCFFTKLPKLQCFCVWCFGQTHIVAVGRYFDYICNINDLYKMKNESAMDIGFKGEFDKVFAGAGETEDDTKNYIETFFEQFKKLVNKMIPIDIKVSFCIFNLYWSESQSSIEQQALQKKLINDNYEKFKADCIQSRCPEISKNNKYWASIRTVNCKIEKEYHYDGIFFAFRVNTCNYVRSRPGPLVACGER